MALKCLATYPNMAIYGGQIVIIPHILAPPAGPPAVFYGGFEPSPVFRRHNRLIRRNGIPPIIVAGMLGHSLAILMTTYAHYIPGTQDEAARLMDEILTPIPIDIKSL